MFVCDGIRSQNNNLNLKNGLKTSGSVVFRKIYSNTDLIQAVQNNINVWMGNDCHLVSYPINNIGHINIVFAVNRKLVKKIMNISKKPEFLIDLLKIKNRTLIDLLKNIQDWKKWPLYNTGFITKVNHITEGRVLFMGDAAHPLYPHLAQGAAMALEDGRVLFKLLKKNKGIYDETFQEFATSRFRRCQRMQIESQINGHIFQLGWPLRDIRNMFIKTLGSRLIDKSWIYKF
jgi:salicylate hydroxylase